MKEREYREMYTRYINDPQLHGFTRKLVELYQKAVPIALGKDGFIYSSEVNELDSKIRLLQKDYILKNYSRLIDGN